MADDVDVLEELHDDLEESAGAVAVLMDDDEGILTYFYDSEADGPAGEASLRTTTLLTSAGVDFLEALERWALEEAARRANAGGSVEADVINPPDDVGDPEGPEFQ